jgi:hypothetical protein
LSLRRDYVSDVEIVIPQWQPHDFPFPALDVELNPFGVSFSALVQGPGTGSFIAHGFYDGDNVWTLRIAPWAEGIWSVRTRSTNPDLDGRELMFQCVANADSDAHGGIQIDAEHPYHFVHEDGSPYYLMGYECDWLWALDTDDANLSTLGPFLDTLVEHGFNHILLNVYAHDCSWQEGTSGPDDYGPPPLYAWEGDNDAPDHTRFNLKYWQHYDRVIDALYRRGIVAHIMIKVYNKMVNWPANGGTEDDQFFRWVVSRYAAYPNVVWDLSKESNNEPDLDYKIDRIRFVRRHDPYGRLMTTHDDEAVYDTGAYCSELDFHSDQHHSDWYNETIRKRRQHPWPIVNVEFGYEHGPGGMDDKTYGVTQSPEELCRRAWEISMAGGYVAYYYTYTAWDVIRPNDIPPGYRYFKLLREFFEATDYKRMEPRDDLVTRGHCLANPGVEYVVFVDESSPFTLHLEDLGDPLEGYWYRPFSGTLVGAGPCPTGTLELSPPVGWDGEPVVFHCRT